MRSDLELLAEKVIDVWRTGWWPRLKSAEKLAPARFAAGRLQPEPADDVASALTSLSGGNLSAGSLRGGRLQP